MWKRVARIAGQAAVIWFGAVFGLILIYRFLNPPVTTFMLGDYLSGSSVTQSWAPIERISPNLVRAVIGSEDFRFCAHPGIDFKEIEHAIETAGDGIPRGASTISMQVTKNLFLSSSKSYLRKAVELPLTFLIELFWPKSRIIEVYLNIAEWGPGVYGAEAAAQYHFGKSAAKLSEGEAALLAVALPNPAMRDAGDPGPMTRKLASAIQSRMRNLGSAADCILKRE